MNTLYYGDNLEVLRKYVRAETVDLCYCDPPFNSKRNYNQIYNNVGNEDRAQAQAFVDTWLWDEQADAGFTEILGNDKGRFASQTVDLLNEVFVSSQYPTSSEKQISGYGVRESQTS